jgi:chromosome segregation ATPase
MPSIAEQFLITEQAASALLDELENLKAETQHYSTASMALDAAGRSLSGLANETADLAARTRDLVLATKEIGTERLLEELDGLTTRSTAQADKLQRLDQLVRGLSENTSAASAAVEALSVCLQQKQAETDNCLKQVLTRVDHVGASLISCDQKIDAARTTLTELKGESDELVSSVGGLGPKLDGWAMSTERRLQALESANARVLQSVRLAGWTALAAFASSLAILIYLLTNRH